jgi:protein tyrosine phosphatase (PTP) superfamily phosphohydrolase (DUF442 family)
VSTAPAPAAARSASTHPPLFRLEGGLAGGPQPTRAGLERLARLGFRSILNLSAEGEPLAPLSPNVEASWAHALDLVHARLALFHDQLRAEHVELFRAALARLPRPTFVGSLTGQRAAAFLTLELALTRGYSAEVALEAARGQGLEFDDERLRRFVLAELVRRTASAAR